MAEQRTSGDWQEQQRRSSQTFDERSGEARRVRAQDERRWPEDYGRGSGSGRGMNENRDRELNYGQRDSGHDQQGWPNPGFAQPDMSFSYGDAVNRKQGPYRGLGPKNYSRSDDRIREDVCEGLSEDGDIDASDIEVDVTNGEVTLTGNIRSREQRRKAEDCAEQVSGVKHVQNNIRVTSTNMSGANQEGIGNMGSRGATGLGGQSGTGVPGNKDF